MTDRHWDPRPGDDARIRAHLARQSGLADPDRWVWLDTGEIVRVGADAEGEADECQ